MTANAHDWLYAVNAGPATSGSGGPESAPSSVKSLRPVTIISTKRRQAADEPSAAVIMPLSTTKASVKSRLGEAVTSDQQPIRMIPTKRKVASETAAVDSLPLKAVKGSIKSRLGSPTASESGFLISSKSKLTGETVGQPKTAKLVPTRTSSVQSRLGNPTVSEVEPRVMISTKRKPLVTAAVGQELSLITSSEFKTVFSRLGPSQV